MIELVNKTVTDDYKDSQAGGAGEFAWGTLIVTAAPVAVMFLHGARGLGQQQEYTYLPPGTYPLNGPSSDRIVGLQFKNAVAGQSPAGVVSVWLYEPGRAGLQPTAVLNPLASSGITRITSNDGSVTVVNPTGPTVDLSILAALGNFLKWGTNTDSGAAGLTLNGAGAFAFKTGGAGWTNTTSGGSYSVATGGGAITLDTTLGLGTNGSVLIKADAPGTLTLDAGVSNYQIKNFWTQLVSNAQNVSLTATLGIATVSGTDAVLTASGGSATIHATTAIKNKVNAGNPFTIEDNSGNVVFRVTP